MKETFHHLMRQTRSVRCFQESKRLSDDTLIDFIDLARLSGSTRNGQLLKYTPIVEEKLCAHIFPHLTWAAYLADWPGPEPGKRPSAYIVCLLDTNLQRGPENEASIDLGIASQSILLGAAVEGISGCRIGAFNVKAVSELLQLPAHLRPLLVIALGYPAEKVVLEDLQKENDIRYWHDEHGVHHVPKRSLQEVVHRVSEK